MSRLAVKKIHNSGSSVLAEIDHDSKVISLNMAAMKGFSKQEVEFVKQHEIGHHVLQTLDDEIACDAYALEQLKNKGINPKVGLNALIKSPNVGEDRIRAAVNKLGVESISGKSYFNEDEDLFPGPIGLSGKSQFDPLGLEQTLNPVSDIIGTLFGKRDKTPENVAKLNLEAQRERGQNNLDILALQIDAEEKKAAAQSALIVKAVIGAAILAMMVIVGIVVTKKMKANGN